MRVHTHICIYVRSVDTLPLGEADHLQVVTGLLEAAGACCAQPLLRSSPRGLRAGLVFFHCLLHHLFSFCRT